MSRIALITGSTRSPRVGPDIARWVHNILKTQSSGLQIEPIAIADFGLPIFDEPVIPAAVPTMAQFTKDHSKKWSETIASFQGYIFVIPEYNGGLAGGTKNAIDYLYNELPGKPVAIISYGQQGGNRANAHLSETLELIMKMKVVPTKVMLTISPGADMTSAATKGVLGDESQKAWMNDGKPGQIVMALEEIKQTLESAA